MKKLVLLLLLGVGALQGAHAQSYVLRIPQPGMTASPLSVASVSPASGPHGAATPFTITGEHFDETLVVEVGGIVATCGVPTKTTVSCASPLQPADGTYPVAVARADGGRDASKTFTYTPTGPAGVLVKISSAQSYGIAFSPNGELLVLRGRSVERWDSNGAVLGQAFSGSSFATASGCRSGSPDLRGIAVDSAGKLYLGGNCYSSTGYSRAAVWTPYSTSSASAVTPSWGDSNSINGLTAAGSLLYARFTSNAGTGGYHGEIWTSNGALTGMPSHQWNSTIAYAGAPYMVNASSRLVRYSAGAWTVVGQMPSGGTNQSQLAYGADDFLYYLPGSMAALHKIDPATGSIVKSWPTPELSALEGSLNGLAVNSSGKPFISVYSGVWRLD